MKFDTAKIMRRAWDIYHENSDSEARAVFGLCLSMAWDEEKRAPARVLGEWVAMSIKQQISLVTACIKRAAKDEIGRSTEDNYLRFDETVVWGLFGRSMDELVNEAWLKLAPMLTMEYLTTRNERRRANGRAPLGLVSLVYWAGRYAIRKVWNEDKRHQVADVHTVQGKDGEEYDYIETMMKAPRADTEKTALFRVSLESAMSGRDEVDRAIIAGIRDGYTERQIGFMVGMSGPAVHKRIEKLRAALREAIA